MIEAGAVDGAVDTKHDTAFADFFAQHYERALRLAMLLEGEPHRAEDAVCDAFARSYAKWRRGSVTNIDAYLRQAVVNSVRGSWRRRATERKHSAALERQVHAPDFDRNVAERDSVWSALRQIAPGQRRVVVLRYYEDLDEREVARLLGISVGTVKSQAAKGLAALQELLRGEE